ncbi:MAG: EAL domain-containing protein [bacterium]|nr:EAL domain-containing protein [bacterium]
MTNATSQRLLYVMPSESDSIFPAFHVDEVIETRNIAVYFQPIIRTSPNRIVALQALSRGIHPNHRNLIPSSYLFQQADESERTQALERVCVSRALERFADLRLYFENARLFIKIAPQSACDRGFQSFLLEETRRYRIAPPSVVLEIPVIAGWRDILQKTLNELTEQEYKIAIDLKNAPVSKESGSEETLSDYLKMDIRRMTRNAPLAADGYLTARGKRPVFIIEGIENAAQAAAASSVRGAWRLGYYYSPPVNATSMPPMLLQTFLSSAVGEIHPMPVSKAR